MKQLKDISSFKLKGGRLVVEIVILNDLPPFDIGIMNLVSPELRPHLATRNGLPIEYNKNRRMEGLS